MRLRARRHRSFCSSSSERRPCTHPLPERPAIYPPFPSPQIFSSFPRLYIVSALCRSKKERREEKRDVLQCGEGEEVAASYILPLFQVTHAPKTPAKGQLIDPFLLRSSFWAEKEGEIT